jgi:hypothetical protein
MAEIKKGLNMRILIIRNYDCKTRDTLEGSEFSPKFHVLIIFLMLSFSLNLVSAITKRS